MSYLEDFKMIKKYRYISLNPKLVFTAVGHLSVDSFKIWIKNFNGLKLVTSDHGGNLKMLEIFSLIDL